MIWTVIAKVERVVDGDTVVVTLDLGWRIYREGEKIRILGVNTPERGRKGWKAATDFARELLPVGSICHITSEAKPTFERTLGRIRLEDGRDFAEAMIEAGLGVPA